MGSSMGFASLIFRNSRANLFEIYHELFSEGKHSEETWTYLERNLMVFVKFPYTTLGSRRNYSPSSFTVRGDLCPAVNRLDDEQETSFFIYELLDELCVK